MPKTLLGKKYKSEKNNSVERQITTKIKVRQLLDFIRIGKEAGLKYRSDAIDLLIRRYDAMQGKK